MHNKKLLIILALSLSALLTLSACQQTKPGGSGTTGKPGGTSHAKDTLVVVTENETPSVTTVDHNAVAGEYMNWMTYNGLFQFDENLVPQKMLVDDYEILSDTEWLFKLKKGVKFHNGAEMKAEDVKASLELCKVSPQVAQYGQSTGKIEVIDDYTIKITTDGPQSDLLGDLCHHGNYIIPAELIKNGHDFNKEPIGTGPYKLVEWKKGESLEFEAFADYFNGEPPIKKVIWKIIPEGSSRSLALEAGEADLIIEVNGTDIERLKNNPKLNVMSVSGTSHNFMMINNEKAPFNNQAFRRALDAAIDKDAVVQVAISGTGTPCDPMIPSVFPGATAEKAPTYNVEQAKKYFAESGLSPEECKFDLICSNDMKLRAGQVIQNNLKENLGIDIKLVTLDLSTYLDVTSNGDYQAAIGGYTAGTVLSYAMNVYHSSAINAANKTRTNVKEIDELIEKMQATIDPDENLKVVAEFCKAINDNCPQVPLFMRDEVRAYNAKLQGFNCNAIGKTDFAKLSWGE